MIEDLRAAERAKERNRLLCSAADHCLSRLPPTLSREEVSKASFGAASKGGESAQLILKVFKF